MLNKLCQNLLNYFAKPEDAVKGTFVIVNDTVSPPLPVNDGQRVWIRGSTMNDGVYTYHNGTLNNDDDTGPAGLTNETFDGAVWPMRVPRDMLELATEISEWVDKYSAALDSPYYSENVIGVYSYQKAKSNSSGSDDSGDVTWQSKFSNRLNRWRKISL